MVSSRNDEVIVTVPTAALLKRSWNEVAIHILPLEFADILEENIHRLEMIASFFVACLKCLLSITGFVQHFVEHLGTSLD